MGKATGFSTSPTTTFGNGNTGPNNAITLSASSLTYGQYLTINYQLFSACDNWLAISGCVLDFSSYSVVYFYIDGVPYAASSGGNSGSLSINTLNAGAHS